MKKTNTVMGYINVIEQALENFEQGNSRTIKPHQLNLSKIHKTKTIIRADYNNIGKLSNHPKFLFTLSFVENSLKVDLNMFLAITNSSFKEKSWTFQLSHPEIIDLAKSEDIHNDLFILMRKELNQIIEHMEFDKNNTHCSIYVSNI